MKELVLAFLIFTLICFLAAAHKARSKQEVLVYVLGEEQPEVQPSSTCGHVLGDSHPYKAFDNCMASCGGCNAYNTEPVLREMVFFNNIYDKEHSYECDPVTLAPFARVHAD
jgi:hypothetical protein